MGWLLLWAVVTAGGAAGLIASINGRRFARRIAREANEIVAASRQPPAIDPRRLALLPDPVRRYLAKALGGRTRAIRTVHLVQSGRFRISLDGRWLPIRGEQSFTADPPAFVWWGRVRLAPGAWVDARDRSAGGAGGMLIAVESTLTLADRRGPELDQGALLRLLGEIPWMPAVALDERYVTWSAVDDRQARATLRVGGREVTGTFEFDGEGLPAAFTAERYRDVGGGRAVLTPFVGRIADFRDADGMLVPHRVVAAWIVDGRTHEYAEFIVDRIVFGS